MKKDALLLANLALWSLAPVSLAQKASQEKTMNITLKIGNQTLKATLTDSATTRDFLSLLPLTLTLEDHGGTEKIASPPRKLSTQGAAAGGTPRASDIAYYAPWGNLALYHKDFPYSSGLIILGKLEGSLDVLRQPGKINVTIQRAK